MAGNERKENYRRPYRNPRYKGRNENAAETAEEVKIPRRAAHIERTTSETDIQLSIDLDGSGESDIDTGIGTADDAGNVLSDDVYTYKEDERSYYALNVAVTEDNYTDFTDSTVVWEPVSKQLDESAHPSKKVWLNIYNSGDNFLGSTYQPLLQKYDDLLNLDIEYIAGDGQTESNVTNRLGNPSQYDAFAINMVKTDNAASYTAILNQ